jgi:hypothetical protein
VTAGGDRRPAEDLRPGRPANASPIRLRLGLRERGSAFDTVASV